MLKILIALPEDVKSKIFVTTNRNVSLKQAIMFSENLATAHTNMSVSHTYVFRMMVISLRVDYRKHINITIFEILIVNLNKKKKEKKHSMMKRLNKIKAKLKFQPTFASKIITSAKSFKFVYLLLHFDELN